MLSCVFLVSYQTVADLLLGQSMGVRLVSVVAMVFPLGFFMGMPFPLGILAISREPAGAVAWAWGMNGTFTVIGGILAGILALFIGFASTMMADILVYLFAMLLYSQLRTRTVSALAFVPAGAY